MSRYRFWGPVQCSRRSRGAARFRCPQTPSATTAALAAGLLLFAFCVGGMALAGARGDVTGDGIVDGADADRVLEAVVGTRALTPAERAAADVDGDGDADVADAQLIRQRSATSAPGDTTP